jgi:hydroxymethylbilane synthase
VTRSTAGAALVVGTRRSALARRQAEQVVEALASAWPALECEIRALDTQGDRTQREGVPLPEIGGKGLFTAELERAIRDGEVEVAVHSLKDLPTEDADDVVIGAICSREDARDCLVARDGLALGDLPERAVVGTSSLRRTAQLLALRPDLDVRSIRGNVDTRIRKVREGEYDAVALAAAGIRRLGLEAEVSDWLEDVVPAPGQGALAVQCRAGDERVLELLAAIDDAEARAATSAERTFLRALGGGCAAPVAAHARVAEEPSYNLSQASNAAGEANEPSYKLSLTDFRAPLVTLRALVASPDGREVVRVEGKGEPVEVGERLAREALAAGADRILEAIRG